MSHTVILSTHDSPFAFAQACEAWVAEHCPNGQAQCQVAYNMDDLPRIKITVVVTATFEDVRQATLFKLSH